MTYNSRPPGVRKPGGMSPEREHIIAKLAVLKAAANFAATRSDIKSGDVLKIAATWIAWVEAR